MQTDVVRSFVSAFFLNVCRENLDREYGTNVICELWTRTYRLSTVHVCGATYW